MRSAGLTGVFSFCSPSRAPISTMWTASLIWTSRGWLQLGELDALLHDIADLALDRLQGACERRAQGLLHLHHFEGEDRRALFQLGALLRQHGNNRARQRRHDLVLAGLFLGLAAERIDPMQLETAVASPQIKLVTFDNGCDPRRDAVQRQIDVSSAGIRQHRDDEGLFAVPQRYMKRG